MKNHKRCLLLLCCRPWRLLLRLMPQHRWCQRTCCGFRLEIRSRGDAPGQPSKIVTATRTVTTLEGYVALLTIVFNMDRLQCLPGEYCSSGYRIPLALALSEPQCGGCPMPGGGWNITTMGTFSTGPSYTPVQWHRHEGHPGWTINMIDKILNESLKTSHTPPDLITIHLGTT